MNLMEHNEYYELDVCSVDTGFYSIQEGIKITQNAHKMIHNWNGIDPVFVQIEENKMNLSCFFNFMCIFLDF